MNNMKKATQNLVDDHVSIILLIEVMERIFGSGIFETEHLEKIVSIIKNFADGVHHAKEENLFFPFLGTKGFSSTHGPVAVMLNEHVAGRNFVKGMSEGISSYKGGNKKALEDIFRNMSGYAELLRNHITKENNILFRMADNVISDTDDSRLLEAFAEAEKNHASFAGTQDYPSQIKELADYYKVKIN